MYRDGRSDDPAQTAAEQSREIRSPTHGSQRPACHALASVHNQAAGPSGGPACLGPPPGRLSRAQVAQGSAASARSGPDENHEMAANYHSGHQCRALLTIRKARPPPHEIRHIVPSPF